MAEPKKSLSELNAELASRESLIDQKSSDLKELIGIELKVKKENEDEANNLSRQRSVLTATGNSLRLKEQELEKRKGNLEYSIKAQRDSMKSEQDVIISNLAIKNQELESKAIRIQDTENAIIEKKSSAEVQMIEAIKKLKEAYLLESNLKKKLYDMDTIRKELEGIKKKLQGKIAETEDEKKAYTLRKSEVDDRDRVVALMKAGIKNQQDDLEIREKRLHIAKLRMMKDIEDNNIEKTLAQYGA